MNSGQIPELRPQKYVQYPIFGDTEGVERELHKSKASLLTQLRGTVVVLGITLALVLAVIVLPVAIR